MMFTLHVEDGNVFSQFKVKVDFQNTRSRDQNTVSDKKPTDTGKEGR